MALPPKRTKNPLKKKPQKQPLEAIRLAWEIGRLKYKLQPRQQEVYEIIQGCKPEDIFCVLCTRGFGKTFTGCTLAMETAIQEPGTNILIISSTLKKLRTIVKPAFLTLLRDCPDDLKPHYNSQDSFYEFVNGSRVHLCAAEHGRIEDLRGIHNVSLVLIDEAAFFGDEDDSYPLNYVVESILTPMFLRTASKARIIMMSTPAEIPNHPFQDYCNRAKLADSYAEFDIYHSDLPQERIEETRLRYTSEDSWQRECLCKWVVDTNRTVIPEFNEGLHVGDVLRPPYFDLLFKSMACDLGVIDKTTALFAYYDFPRGTIQIQNEFYINGADARTDVFADKVKAMEKDLAWKDMKVTRWSDNSNLMLLNDLLSIHGLAVFPTEKDNKVEQVNKVRLLFQQNRIKISPKCKLLIATLKSAFWDKHKKDFGRTTALGHMDMLDALIYLVRNINMYVNPFPADYGYNKLDHVYPANWDFRAHTQDGKILEQIFSKGLFGKAPKPNKPDIMGGL